jgi:hypothetical protein
MGVDRVSSSSKGAGSLGKLIFFGKSKFTVGATLAAVEVKHVRHFTKCPTQKPRW